MMPPPSLTPHSTWNRLPRLISSEVLISFKAVVPVVPVDRFPSHHKVSSRNTKLSLTHKTHQ